jgi:hypothetical protein
MQVKADPTIKVRTPSLGDSPSVLLLAAQKIMDGVWDEGTKNLSEE